METDPQNNMLDRLAQAGRVERQARMPELDRKLTANEQDQLRGSVNRWVRANGISQQCLAARLEVSRTTISEVLKGSYRADPSKVLLELDELIRNTKDITTLTDSAPLAPVRISTVEDMDAIVNAARDTGTCALIWGPSGAGKSTYAKGRANEKASCLYINLTGKGYTPSRLLRHIARDMRLIGGLLEYKNSPDLLYERITNALSGLSRVLFIDNAHLLDKHGLWCLHSIHDASGAIIVCIGQPLLWDTVNKSRNDRGIGATVYGRFGLKLSLESAASARVDPTDPQRQFRPKRKWLHTPEDVRKYLDSRKLKVHPGVVAWLHKVVNCPDFAGFHEIEDIANMAERCFPGEVLTLDIIGQIDSIIRPPEEQTRLRDAVEQIRAVAG